MHPADIDAVSALAARIWHAHYITMVTREQIDYMLEMMYSAASLKTQMENGHRFWLAEENGALTGYISAQAKQPGTWHIHKLYVDQDRARSGLGSALLAHAIAELQPRELTLNVNRRNIKAVNFYFKHGFAIDRTADTDIGSGFLMEDFVMKRTL